MPPGAAVHLLREGAEVMRGLPREPGCLQRGLTRAADIRIVGLSTKQLIK